MREYLGDHTVDAYVKMKNIEIQESRVEISRWEMQTYLDC